MKLTEKIARHNQTEKRPFFTLEFFPPKTDQGFENLLSRISRLGSLNPLAINITWGAGGSTKNRSLELAASAQQEYGIDAVLHLTCTNMERQTIDDTLKGAKERGIQNILALRGDPPRGEEYWIPTDPRFQHGIDLVSYIRSEPEYTDFCIGVAAYPDGHPENETDEDSELDNLKKKVDAGADYIVTQLFYDVDSFIRWEKKVREKGITVPIIPGIMPIQTYASFIRVTKLCGTRIPPSLMADLAPIRHDDQMVKDYGVNLAIQMIKRLTVEANIPGVHICTLNLEKSIQRVSQGLGWIRSVDNFSNRLIADASDSYAPGSDAKSEFITDAHKAADSAANHLTVPQHVGINAAGEAGKGEITNAMSWDDFPNGRFGDFKSPAFGDLNPWGTSDILPNQALKQWGRPKTEADITDVFLRYLHSKITATPFSPAPLLPESVMILQHLERLTQKGWWTVGSQPAIDGAPSSDELVGWGPKGGYVYQKCFVDFFVEEEDVDRIEKKVQEQGKGWVDYFASNLQGDFRTNVAEDGRNAVTWGIFPGQEVAQSTIIEQESFLAWKQEAFDLWYKWASYFSPESEERKLLDGVRHRRWLVSIVHHDYKNPEALWEFLFGRDRESALI